MHPNCRWVRLQGQVVDTQQVPATQLVCRLPHITCLTSRQADELTPLTPLTVWLYPPLPTVPCTGLS